MTFPFYFIKTYIKFAEFLIIKSMTEFHLNSLHGIQRTLINENTRKSKALDSTNFLADLQRLSLASQQAKILIKQINDFDESLDSDQEVGVRLVYFGQSITFHVSNIGYFNPSLIVFLGLTEEGKPIQLIQHVSQISFLLMALPKLNPEKPKKRIGFIQESN
ncbi:DUF6173 family protein [Nostoc sp. FACHB-888]|uniref:DUF6173 family protein n=1 Tax=Nostoc sp. FACHB-888 TaxID=2692842 RepID=UPI001682C868|nr:DUF6173 family protein [Nostoc sp. FACHB-888]MBD2247559.1 hypothetical protein [Nostoc sp. FACHB-888]